MASTDRSAPDPRSRQKRVGEVLRADTRNRILEAAASEFETRGYSATTVASLAKVAGVSVQTLYLAWGSKRALLRGYLEKALAGDAASPEEAAGRFAEDLSPAERVALLAAVVADVARRAAIGWSIYRDAAGSDTEIAEDWSELQMKRHRLFARIIGHIPEEHFAPGLTGHGAVDTAWVIASPETYSLLVTRLGYDLGRYRDWVEQTLTRALLVDPTAPRDRGDG
ncbi:TetR/AcrR family transcriptional regulator [Microbacterium testaceum]|uniref:TetR/AcrR family transcriptional regulator n=1 Tax=Microbacterium testaceum TaxID=2033 RepID=A0A2T7WQV1_MICTE|nr:TetR/AcrR family transcriptional regulator [Microbacterium testaceum]PVE76136.1 TetR/AcrR family transcriptional regulator [Microbacterium testaceum]